MLNLHSILPVSPRSGRHRGFTLVELMVAITLSMVILAALSQTFVYNSRDRNEMENVTRQVENGRYAVRVLSDSIQHAGFMGELDVDIAMKVGTPLTIPTSKPDPCATDLATLRNNMLLPIQGYNVASQKPSCIDDVKASSDILVVRHASTCARGSLDCNDLAGAPYFQASQCNNNKELSTSDAQNFYRLNTDINQLDRTQRDCATVAVARRFLTHIYFIANNDQTGDGIPTLKRAELGATSFTVQSIANGIEEVEFEYGIDTNDDNVIDAYTANPDAFNGCGGATDPSGCSTRNWFNVLSVKIHVLARSPEVTPGHKDTKRYTVGLSSNDVDPIRVGPFNDGYKRHVYESVVSLMNPMMR